MNCARVCEECGSGFYRGGPDAFGEATGALLAHQEETGHRNSFTVGDRLAVAGWVLGFAALIGYILFLS